MDDTNECRVPEPKPNWELAEARPNPFLTEERYVRRGFVYTQPTVSRECAWVTKAVACLVP